MQLWLSAPQIDWQYMMVGGSRGWLVGSQLCVAQHALCHLPPSSAMAGQPDPMPHVKLSPPNIHKCRPSPPQKLGPQAADKWEVYGADLVQQAVQAAQAEGFLLQGKPEGERCPVQQPGWPILYQLLYCRSL